jgi:hypothetical protein
MDETSTCKPHDYVHERRVESTWGVDLRHLPPEKTTVSAVRQPCDGVIHSGYASMSSINIQCLA